MERAVVREIDKINTFEKQWKIRTNENKFQIISIARQRPPPLRINQQVFEYTKEAKMLGLKFSNRGTSIHLRERLKLSRLQMIKLKRFSGCTHNIKLTLYKTLIRPILEYPPVPLHIITKTNQHKMQAIQNRALKWVSGTRYPDTPTAEALHTQYNMETLNTRLHNLAHNTWSRLEEANDINYANIQTTDENIVRDHYWWPRSLHRARGEPPIPLYVRERPQQPPNPDSEEDE